MRECLDDPDIQIRVASLKALGTMGSEAAKRIIMNKVSDKPSRRRGQGIGRSNCARVRLW